jgi:hypothetical protein
VRSKGSQPAKKPTSRKTTPKPKVSKKTSKAKTSKSKKDSSDLSVRTSRARSPKQPDPATQTPAQLKLGNWGRGPGRPKDTPNVWTQEHKDEVAGWIYDYADSADMPSEAEFCMRYGVRQQRLGEFAELIAAKEYLQAKRSIAVQARVFRLNKETGSQASYLNRMSANVGVFSMTDKSEFQIDDRRPINLAISPEQLKNDPNAEVSNGD